MIETASLSELQERLAHLDRAHCEDCAEYEKDVVFSSNKNVVPATWVAVEYYPSPGGFGPGYCDTFMCRDHALKALTRERGDKTYTNGWWYVSFTGIAERRRELERAIKEQETIHETA